MEHSQKQITERTHHAYSPSSLQSLEACPAFQSRENKHERTIAGSKAHGMAESGTDDVTVSDEDAAAVAECLDFYESRRRMAFELRTNAMVHPSGTIDYSVLPVIELKETYLPVDTVSWEETTTDFSTGEKKTQTVKATTAGYIDAAIITHDRTYAEVFDYKFGMWAVEDADNNLQGIAYALGMLHVYPELKAVRFWFKQPHIDGLSERLVTRDEVPKLYLRIQVVVARAKAARASGTFDMATPRIPNCNFCAHIGACHKVAEFACKVGHKFHPIEIPADITPSRLHDPQETSLLMSLSQVMGVWAKSARTQVTDRVLRGASPIPPGFKIQEKADREIVDPAKYKEEALKALTPEEYESTLTQSFGAVEEFISAKAPRGQKKAAIETFKQSLEASGAVKKGQPYSFLRAETKEKSETKETQTQNP